MPLKGFWETKRKVCGGQHPRWLNWPNNSTANSKQFDSREATGAIDARMRPKGAGQPQSEQSSAHSNLGKANKKANSRVDKQQGGQQQGEQGNNRDNNNGQQQGGQQQGGQQQGNRTAAGQWAAAGWTAAGRFFRREPSVTGADLFSRSARVSDRARLLEMNLDRGRISCVTWKKWSTMRSFVRGLLKFAIGRGIYGAI